MLWDDPQFPHGSEPKALKLLQGGTLWEAMMGVIIRETVEALYGALCGTLGQSYNWEHKCFRSFILYHHKGLVF
jgi:hypothetical protein